MHIDNNKFEQLAYCSAVTTQNILLSRKFVNKFYELKNVELISSCFVKVYNTYSDILCFIFVGQMSIFQLH